MIYFVCGASQNIGARELVKIGHSTDVADRLANIGTACPFRIGLLATVPGDAQRERAIRGLFAKWHVHKEWFWLVPEIEDWIEKQEGVEFGDIF